MAKLPGILLFIITGLICFSSHSIAQVVWDRTHLDKIRDQPPSEGTLVADALEILRTRADLSLIHI